MGWKNCCCIGVVVLLCILPVSQADNSSSSIFNFILDNSPMSVTNVDGIEYNQNEWNPDKDWQKKGYTKAWVDVVGYNGLVKYDNTFYINQPHTTAAYILYGTKPSLASKYSFDSLTSKITDCSYDGSGVTAVIGTKLKYHWTRKDCHYNLEGKKKCKDVTTGYKKENRFSEIDINPPLKYPSNIILKNITVVVYNNSLQPKTIINLPQVNYTLGYRVEFDNESVEYYYNILEIEYLDNDFPYGNLTPFEYNSIYEHSDMFSRGGNNVILNASNMSIINNSLYIYIITPYEEQQINFSVVNGSDIFKIENTTLSNIFSLFILGWIVVFLIKYYRY